MIRSSKNPSAGGGTFRQRYEVKYRVNEFQAAAIRAFISPFVAPDKLGGPKGEYGINSIYLDSPDLKLFRSSATGEKNRIKLRIRSYTEAAEDLAFLEVKRRKDQTIGKTRAGLAKPHLPALLGNSMLEMSEWGVERPKDRSALLEFARLTRRFEARPCTAVRYDREAYAGRFSDSVRITFDRNLACLPCPAYSPDIWRYDDRWLAVPHLGIVLEIKFNNAFPAWVRDLVERFDLLRESVSKYVLCVLALREKNMLIR